MQLVSPIGSGCQDALLVVLSQDHCDGPLVTGHLRRVGSSLQARACVGVLPHRASGPVTPGHPCETPVRPSRLGSVWDPHPSRSPQVCHPSNPDHKPLLGPCCPSRPCQPVSILVLYKLWPLTPFPPPPPPLLPWPVASLQS